MEGALHKLPKPVYSENEETKQSLHMAKFFSYFDSFMNNQQG